MMPTHPMSIRRIAAITATLGAQALTIREQDAKVAAH